MDKSSAPMHILLVDDNDIDIQATRRALVKSGVHNPLVIACDGAQALELLKGEQGREMISQPCLILLDINMPRMNGFEFLQELRKQPDLSRNVVFMLTTSDRPEDKQRAYELNTAGYVLKENLGNLAIMIHSYSQANEAPEE